MFRVASLTKPTGDSACPEDADLWQKVEEGSCLGANATLEPAMPVFERSGLAVLPVLSTSEDRPPEL